MKLAFIYICFLAVFCQAQTSGVDSAKSPRASEGERQISLKPCAVPGVTQQARCGTLSVFENRQTKKGRRVELNILVFPAQDANPAPDPVFALAGGPGQGAAQVTAALFYRDLESVNRSRDIVLVDQRGTGKSNPLNCRIDSLKEAIRYIGGEYPIANWKKCREELEKNADLRFYTTPFAMDDLDEVRKALGYKQINVFGGSYGSRAALVYLRQYRKQVRSVVLRAPVSINTKIPLYIPGDAQKALNKLLDDCATDAKCARAYPNLRQNLKALFDRLTAAPAAVNAKDPRSGETVEFRITRDVFAAGVFYLLFSSDLSKHLPFIVTSAINGNYNPFLSVAVPVAVGLMSQISTGMYQSVLCAEDVPQVKKRELVRHSKGTFLGEKSLLNAIEICSVWARGHLPAGYFQPIKSKAPILIISGEVDPTVPPRWGASIARNLPNSRHVVIPGVAHGPNFPGCIRDLVTRFIADASSSALDITCVSKIRRPDFTLPPTKSASKSPSVRVLEKEIKSLKLTARCQSG